jgi:hypothetical protein
MMNDAPTTPHMKPAEALAIVAHARRVTRGEAKPTKAHTTDMLRLVATYEQRLQTLRGLLVKIGDGQERMVDLMREHLTDVTHPVRAPLQGQAAEPGQEAPPRDNAVQAGGKKLSPTPVVLVALALATTLILLLT